MEATRGSFTETRLCDHRQFIKNKVCLLYYINILKSQSILRLNEIKTVQLGLFIHGLKLNPSQSSNHPTRHHLQFGRSPLAYPTIWYESSSQPHVTGRIHRCYMRSRNKPTNCSHNPRKTRSCLNEARSTTIPRPQSPH